MISWQTIKGKKEARAEKTQALMALLNKATEEKRTLTETENAQFTELEKEARNLEREIIDLEAQYHRNDPNARQLPGREAINCPASTATEWRDARGNAVAVYTDLKQRIATETRNLSAGRAIRSLITGDWSGAEDEQRAVQLTAGGILLPPSIVAGTLDATRDQSVIFQAGAAMVEMNTPSLDVAKLTTAPTAQVKTEGAAFSGTTGALGRLTLAADTIVTIVEVSRELMQDAPNAYVVIDEAIAEALAKQLDTLAFTAIAAGSGVQTVATVGALTDYAELVSAWSKVLTAGGKPNAYVVAAAVAGQMEGLLAAVDGQYLAPPASIAALAKFVSPAIVPDGGGLSDAYLGDFRKVIVGLRQDVLIEASNEPGFDKHTVKVKLTYRGDIGIAKPTHFCVLEDIDTTP